MILTRRKPSQNKDLDNGTHFASIASISEIGNSKCVLLFSSNKGQIRLELPINESTHKLIGQIGFIGGIAAGKEVNFSDLIGLQVKLNIQKGKIKSITKP